MNKRSLLDKILDSDERIAFAKVLDKVQICEKRHEKVFSDFLDPAKASKFLSTIQKDLTGFNSAVYGGITQCERKMIGFSPEYMDISHEDFPITALEVSYNTKYSRELTHRDFLGSIIGLGIDRSKIGDIIIKDESAIVFASQEFADYICTNLGKVGSTKVQASIKSIIDTEVLDEAGEDMRLTVSSLRLDSIISAAFRISRSKSVGLIKGEKVFVNWAISSDSSKSVRASDMITIRGLGRVQLVDIGGCTKKDRTIVFLKKFS